jgi:hypothetical protein
MKAVLMKVSGSLAIILGPAAITIEAMTSLISLIATCALLDQSLSSILKAFWKANLLLKRMGPLTLTTPHHMMTPRHGCAVDVDRTICGGCDQAPPQNAFMYGTRTSFRFS